MKEENTHVIILRPHSPLAAIYEKSYGWQWLGQTENDRCLVLLAESWAVSPDLPNRLSCRLKRNTEPHGTARAMLLPLSEILLLSAESEPDLRQIGFLQEG